MKLCAVINAVFSQVFIVWCLLDVVLLNVFDENPSEKQIQDEWSLWGLPYCDVNVIVGHTGKKDFEMK